MEKKRVRLSYEKQKALCGYGFLSLWMVGTVIFFLIPLLKSLSYSFSEVTITPGSINTRWVGLAKYSYVLTVDDKYPRLLKETLIETAWKTPLILVFSLFIAVILNQKFRGRTLARAVFFLPVIIATGPVYKIISGDMSDSGSTGAEQFSTMFSTDMMGKLLEFLGIYGISPGMSSMISAVADNIFGIVWSSGIQILIFLAALQEISPEAREAAQIEGATGWEYFWKITFPFVSPYILVNLIFSVIDSFTSPTNKVMSRILSMREEWKFGEASAMAWVYFAVVLMAVGIITFFVNKFIYYETE
ncbi:MAG TPA: sugar ABC transporter permease [Ruminococcus sp.]|nr:sugar ABC transporter permease [Ruminococcus sp.]